MTDSVMGKNEHSARSAVMERAMLVAGEMPTPALRSLVCPYCGTITPDTGRCNSCSGRFDPLSRQATQNQMGPWSIRDDRQSHRPGCTYETIARLIEQKKISGETILRGPSTRQFWTLARHTPGVAQLLGLCHSCQAQVKPDAFACPNCHAAFTAERDRQHLGLGPSRPLPGQGLPEVLALQAEPASQQGGSVGMGVGVVSMPIAVQGAQGNGTQSVATSVGDRQQIEEAARLARRWKAAWEKQRRRAWVVMGIALTIAVIAIIYAILATQDGRGTDVQAISEPISQPSFVVADE